MTPEQLFVVTFLGLSASHLAVLFIGRAVGKVEGKEERDAEIEQAALNRRIR